jgi:signal transduction histidine kinase
MPAFRTKARAIELLGKGQIADLPTAISELWKNGYDAYADDLSCDLYLGGYEGLETPIFTISDDGTGMSKKDVEEKWLVIGTDARIRDLSKTITEKERLGKPLRIPMGEKGIGRLSVSYLGPTMLLITKKIGEKCVMLFMDWRLLDNYSLYVDEVNIPIDEINSEKDFVSVFNKLKQELKANFKEEDWKDNQGIKKEISNDVDRTIIPKFLIEDKIKNFSKNESHGTIFIIFNPHEQLLELTKDEKNIDPDQSVYAMPYLRSNLSGLYNAFKKDKPDFTTNFYIHNNKGRYNLISTEEFFTNDDLKLTDHYIKGKFDENGKFTGEIRVFNETKEYTFHSQRKPGETPYGPFQIEVGILEGDPKNSKLPREKFDTINKKLRAFGGLYIYRDNFRILPYGKSEYDWLRFEERRTLHAGFHFFSHRRMFGYIEISRNTNAEIKEKAGREGFITNKAFREFQSDLIAFFEDLSRSYFGTETNKISFRAKLLQKIKQQNEKVVRGEKKRSSQEKLRFKKELKEKYPQIEAMLHDISSLYNSLSKMWKEEPKYIEKIESLIINIEDKKLDFDNLEVIPPTRVKLTDNQINTLNEYYDVYDKISEYFEKSNDLILEIRKKLSENDLKNNLKIKLEQLREDIKSKIEDYKSRFSDVIEILNQQIETDITRFLNLYDEEIKKLQITDEEKSENIASHFKTLDVLHDNILEEIDNKYESFTRHIENLSFDIDDDLLVGWYKDQYEKIMEKVDAMHELAQLGMAIEIIDHQFNVLYGEIADSLDYFNKTIKGNKDAEKKYMQLRNAFEHLESNHKLLTPLYRTMRRSKSEITGEQIKKYLEMFFKNKFEQENIVLTTDKSFDEYVFYTYESVIKPVFINIVNNAIYWLRSKENKKIHISSDNTQVFIMNNGEKIQPSNIEKIFDLFFTRKPGGRGIGLYLVKTNLRAIGYDIIATNETKVNKFNGACFVIFPLKDEKQDEFQ